MKLSEYETQQVHHAAEILTSNLRIYITVSGLAERVRLTERKLKEGFHLEFEKTVYTYYLDARMEKAKQMLLEDIPVRHIARTIGYTGNQAETNFIKAFRKKFKVTPITWSKQQKRRLNKGLPV